MTLFAPVGNGHRSASLAIAEAAVAACPDATVDVLDVLSFAPSWFLYGRLWRFVQEHAPGLWDFGFRVSQNKPPFPFDRPRCWLNRVLLRPLARRLLAAQPDHLVCTHYLPAILASHLVTTGRLRSRLSVVITDHTAHSGWVYEGVSDYFVASDTVARSLVQLGARPDQVHTSGIPISSGMAGPVLPVPAAPRPLRVLLLTGGVLAPLVLETLDSFRKIDVPLTVDVVASGNRLRRDELAEVVRRLPIKATVHAAQPTLRPLLDAAHVVVSKAGGLTMMESFARGRPLVVPWPALAQERGNWQHLLETGAGATPLNPANTGPFIASLAAKRGALAEMGRRALSAARPEAAREIAHTLLSSNHTELDSRRRSHG